MSLRLRLTCPTCGAKWRDGKDPASAGGVFALRGADLVTGLFGDGSVLSCYFQSLEAGPEVLLSRLKDLQDFESLLERAREALMGCPAMLGLAEWVSDNGGDMADPDGGLGSVWGIAINDFLLWTQNGNLRIRRVEE